VAAQVPSTWFAAIVHVPVQQPVPTEHASPGCAQKDDAWHVPLLAQYPEAHWEPDVQGLPTVALVGLSAAHLPPTQLWLQHSAPDPQAPASAVHDGKWHTPPTQSLLQQSPFNAHAALRPRHAPLPVKTPASPLEAPAFPELLPVPWPKAPELPLAPLEEPPPPSPFPRALEPAPPQEAANTKIARMPIMAIAPRTAELLCACMRSLQARLVPHDIVLVLRARAQRSGSTRPLMSRGPGRTGDQPGHSTGRLGWILRKLVGIGPELRQTSSNEV